MNCLVMVFIAVTVTKEITTHDIQNEIQAYFKSEAAIFFQTRWKPYGEMFGSIISITLQQGFGHPTMNVYINRYLKPLEISTGYYHTDNQVHLIFTNMELDELPHIYDGQVTVSLSSNVLSVEASLSKIILRTNYIVFRNKSDIIYSVADQNPYENSPFRFQQVRNVGELAITITGCSLSAIVVATLSGESINLGHNQFRLSECQYSLEIYSTGTGAPPVIANYLPNGEKGSSIENLLLRPLLEELMPKLQASMFANVNTSAVFTDKFLKVRDEQEIIFEKTKDYMDDVIRNMNKKSIENNMGTMHLDDFTIVYDDTFSKTCKNTVALNKIVLMGLDTLYSSHSGGPIRLTEIDIIEQLRFSTLEVMGNVVNKEKETLVSDNEFAVEISDYAVDVTIDSNLMAKFEVLGWRFIEFSCPKMELVPIESLVVGYLLNELPKRIISHLNSVYEGSITKLNHPLDDDDTGFIQEDANDGKYEAPTDEILDNKKENMPSKKAKLLNSKTKKEQIKLNHIDAKPHVEEQEKIKLHHVEAAPHVEDEGPVKLHHVAAVHHAEEHEEVKMNEQVKHGQMKLNKEEEQEKVKLHHVEAAPHVEDEGPVKLHHVAAVHHAEEHEEVKMNEEVKHGQMKLNKEEEEEQEKVKLHHVEAAPHVEDEGPLKLHHVAAVHHVEDHEQVKINNTKEHGRQNVNNVVEHEKVKMNNIKAKSHIDEQGPVKLRHVIAKPHVRERGPVKLHDVVVKPHIKDMKSVKIRSYKVTVGHDEKNDKNLSLNDVVGNNSVKSRKGSQIHKVIADRPKSNKNIKTNKRVSRSMSKVTSATPKLVHNVSDNEIRPH